MILNTVLNRFIPFSRVPKGTCSSCVRSFTHKLGGSIILLNNIFECSRAHHVIKNFSSRKVCQIFDFKNHAVASRFLGDDLFGSDEYSEFFSEMRQIMGFDLEKLSEHSPSQMIAIQLVGPLAAMATYGVASSLLAVHASQLSLVALAALTWGSFRWNEGELLRVVTSAFRKNTEIGHIFQKNIIHFSFLFFVMLSGYLLTFFTMRGGLSSIMTDKGKEAFFTYYKKFGLNCLSENQLRFIAGFPGTVWAPFIDPLDAPREKRDELRERVV